MSRISQVKATNARLDQIVLTRYQTNETPAMLRCPVPPPPTSTGWFAAWLVDRGGPVRAC